MLSTAILSAVAFLPQGGNGTSDAPVVINEFSYDDSGADDYEFVELYNRSGNVIDISGWSIVGDDANGVNFTEVLPAGTVMLPGDHLVIGDANVPNVDIVRASGFLQNDAESITLYDASATPVMIDTLIYEANKGVFNAALAEGEGIWGNFTLVEGNETSWSRIRDGYDTDNNGNDFRLAPWSPGTRNTLPKVPQTVEVFDGQVVGNDATGWQGSYVNPRIIDPATIDANNPSVIPASPQGGNAAVAWDPAGGGNHAMLATDIGRELRAEMYVYIDATPLLSGELEMWSVGFGTSGTFYNFPDPTGLLTFTANGDTGLCWTYVRDDAGATMYLMDRNDGGLGASALSDAVVVGSVPITAGVNDGWQRVLVEVTGTTGSGRFGGTYGANDGTGFSTTVDSVDRGFYIGYREGVAGTVGARPFTFDLATIEIREGALANAYGTGCDGLTLTANGLPTIGNASFALDVNNVVLGPFAFLAFGNTVVNPGVDLGFVGMPGCFGYTSLDIGLFTGGAVSGGTSSFSLPIPAATILAGTVIAGQGLAFSNTTPLNIAATNGLAVVIGY